MEPESCGDLGKRPEKSKQQSQDLPSAGQYHSQRRLLQRLISFGYISDGTPTGRVIRHIHVTPRIISCCFRMKGTSLG